MKRRIINNICPNCDVNLLPINKEVYQWFFIDKDKNMIGVDVGVGYLDGTVICFSHMSEMTNDDIEKFISAVDRLIESKITNNKTNKVKNELREILANWFREESDW